MADKRGKAKRLSDASLGPLGLLGGRLLVVEKLKSLVISIS